MFYTNYNRNKEIIKLTTYYFENIDMCINDLLTRTLLRSDLECKENRQYDEHILHKTYKCKDLHSPVLAEIILQIRKQNDRRLYLMIFS